VEEESQGELAIFSVWKTVVVVVLVVCPTVPYYMNIHHYHPVLTECITLKLG